MQRKYLIYSIEYPRDTLIQNFGYVLWGSDVLSFLCLDTERYLRIDVFLQDKIDFIDKLTSCHIILVIFLIKYR